MQAQVHREETNRIEKRKQFTWSKGLHGGDLHERAGGGAPSARTAARRGLGEQGRRRGDGERDLVLLDDGHGPEEEPANGRRGGGGGDRGPGAALAEEGAEGQPPAVVGPHRRVPLAGDKAVPEVEEDVLLAA